jgi:hypothetical protein
VQVTRPLSVGLFKARTRVFLHLLAIEGDNIPSSFSLLKWKITWNEDFRSFRKFLAEGLQVAMVIS